MSIFGKEIDEASSKMDYAKIRAKEFEGKGLTLQFISVEKIKSQYGADEGNSLVEKGILEEGEQFLFTFKDNEGVERKHYSTSMPFFIGMKQVEINEGDWIHIRREGIKDKTRYYVTVTPAPLSPVKTKPKVQEIKEVDPNDIPF